MRSIRVSLIVYFVLLSTAALAGISYFSYQMSEEALRGRQTDAKMRILSRCEARTREEREKLAATFQLLAHVMWHLKPVTVRVQMGRPVRAKALGTTDGQAIHRAVLAEIRRLYSIGSVASCGGWT